MVDTYGVADGFEEEEREQAANARHPRTVRNAEREGTARDSIDAEQKRRIYPVEQHDAHEAACHATSRKGFGCCREDGTRLTGQP